MFALRSSPSSLVCDLRNTLLPAADGGFQLSAPRPRRATVRLGFDIYYAGGAENHEPDVGLSGGGGGGGGGGSAFSPAVSDYAGVFEAGDPARARESMNTNFLGERPSVSDEDDERAPRGAQEDNDLGGSGHRGRGFLGDRGHGAETRGGAGAPAALDDHDEGGAQGDEDGGLEEDFLFEMEGLKDERQQERGMRAAPTGGGGGGGSGGWGAAAASAASDRGARGRRGEVVVAGGGGGGGAAAPPNFHGTPTYASSLCPPSPSGRGKGVGAVATGAAGLGSGTTLRKPRVIAPRGTRCIGGGMYRLRLSTSC
eukprot:g9690.t1